MATNLNAVLDSIANGLEDQARQSLRDQRAVRSGFLHNNTEVTRNGDDFVVTFPDYGVFVDEGTGSHRFIGPRPFYSNLVVEGEEEGEYEDEIMEMLSDALDLDTQDLDQEIDEII